MAIEAFLGTRPQKAFLFTVILQAVLVLAVVGVIYGKVSDNIPAKQVPTIPCYLALFALAEVFETIITVDALKLRNTIQLIGILLFHSAMIIMSALQIYQTKEALVTQPGADCATNYATCDGPDSLWAFVLRLLIVIPIILALALMVLIWVTRALFLEFGWAVFHAIGADPKMKVMYQYYQIMICLLKFDFFCFTGVTMQLLILVLTSHRAEFVITIVAIPVVLVLLFICGLALQREWTFLMVISLCLMVAAETYFIYKICRVFEPSTAYRYVAVRGSLTTFLIVAAVLLLATFAVGIRCFADFGRGLRKSKMKDPEQQRTQKLGAPDVGTPGMSEQGVGTGGRVQRTFSIE
ncbi:hypothetical protein PIIN_00354 [Serendipita indica DSM 11827]|uniref:Uncharacterized protein n=1 Tax=Serendipita indica (strain DSM 11827) TaxID=1109443 RepID=G4T5S9_SERID|nr:hypothetical protein PIIN_00354 [Serendipita indica DSM 11827]